MTSQLHFLASLDFPGRTTLMVAEIAERLGYTEQHVANWIETGELVAMDGRGKGASRASMRVPIENYQAFVIARLTGPQRDEQLRALPEATRCALILELFTSLPTDARLRALRDAKGTVAA